MRRPNDPGIVGILIFAAFGGVLVGVGLFLFKLYLLAQGRG